MRQDVVNLAGPARYGHAHFIVAHPVRKPPSFRRYDLPERCSLEVLLVHHDNLITLFDPFGESVQHILQTFQLRYSWIIHRSVNLRAEIP